MDEEYDENEAINHDLVRAIKSNDLNQINKFKDVIHSYGDYVFCVAVKENNVPLMDYLIKNFNMSVNGKLQTLYSPIQDAASHNKKEALIYLIENGAIINLPPYYESPISLAYYEGNKEMVEILKSYGAVNDIFNFYLPIGLESFFENIINCMTIDEINKVINEYPLSPDKLDYIFNVLINDKNNKHFIRQKRKEILNKQFKSLPKELSNYGIEFLFGLKRKSKKRISKKRKSKKRVSNRV